MAKFKDGVPEPNLPKGEAARHIRERGFV